MIRLNFVSLVLAITLFACQSKEKSGEIFQKDGAAIGGYDAVAFFSEQKPVKGSSEYSAAWNDAKWLFSSEANMDNFIKSPEKYAPKYGGYCAYGTAEGHKAPTEADTWTIINGKLYFNYNQEVKSLWNKDRNGYIKMADANWDEVKKQ
jgi:YHS domain-containing protein